MLTLGARAPLRRPPAGRSPQQGSDIVMRLCMLLMTGVSLTHALAAKTSRTVSITGF
jgi:hypothetical protein